jgi:hypothetical protein
LRKELIKSVAGSRKQNDRPAVRRLIERNCATNRQGTNWKRSRNTLPKALCGERKNMREPRGERSEVMVRAGRFPKTAGVYQSRFASCCIKRISAFRFLKSESGGVEDGEVEASVVKIGELAPLLFPKKVELRGKKKSYEVNFGKARRAGR